ncbi:mechanosensitive ion channel [Candidatus Saccharibacteria bacterium]|nr:mechanosensitive ion channel [Candidatus Saccharibacteria bacterium]
MDKVLLEIEQYAVNDIWEWFLNTGIPVVLTLVFGWLIYKFGGWLLHRILFRIIYISKRRTWPKRDAEKRANTLAGLARIFWKIATIMVLVSLVVRLLFPEVNLGAIVAGFGVVGLAVGFGAQSLVRDLFAGLFIISENQYRVGDKVELKWNPPNAAVGRVIEIGVRTTTLRDEEDNIIFVPNGAIIQVMNKSLKYQLDRDEGEEGEKKPAKKAKKTK